MNVEDNGIEDFVQNIVDKMDEITLINGRFYLKKHYIGIYDENSIIIQDYYDRLLFYINLDKNDLIIYGVSIKDFTKYDIENDYFQLSTLYPFSKQLYLNIHKIRSFFIKHGFFEKSEEFD